jgi:hypothetical protein
LQAASAILGLVREAPSGLVTFLFTDVEGSAGLWERDEAAMDVAFGLTREKGPPWKGEPYSSSTVASNRRGQHLTAADFVEGPIGD